MKKEYMNPEAEIEMFSDLHVACGLSQGGNEGGDNEYDF